MKFLTLVIILLPNVLLAQFKTDLIVPGFSKTEFEIFMKGQGLFKDYRYERNTDISMDRKFDFKYVHTEDKRVEREMFLTVYEYYFKNDTIFTVKIDPPVPEDSLMSQLNKSHVFVREEKKELGKVYYIYASKNGKYNLYLIDRREYYNRGFSIQAFRH